MVSLFFSEISTFKPTPDPSLDCLNTNSHTSSPPPSPLQLVLSPPIPPKCNTPQVAAQGGPQAPADTAIDEKHLNKTGGGRLEDFLESTTGKPLLGLEPGGLLTLIDDLHSQMLSTPSILDRPLSPMDTFDLVAEPPGGLGLGEQGLDGMDWLDFTMGGERGEETSALGPQTPPSVFSTDFLDSSDLQIHWESCL